MKNKEKCCIHSNNEKIINSKQINILTTLGQGIVYDKKSAGTVKIKGIIEKEHKTIFHVAFPISDKDIDKVVSISKTLNKDNDSRITITFGVNCRFKYEDTYKSDISSILSEDTRKELSKLGIPMLFIFYRWGCQWVDEKLCQFCAIQMLDKEKRDVEKYDKKEKYTSYPFGESRDFLHKSPEFIEFQESFKKEGLIAYVHSQDSDVQSLSLKYDDSFIKKLKKSSDGGFYNVSANKLENHFEIHNTHCIVYGGAYTFIHCIDQFETNKNGTVNNADKQNNLYYTTNLSVILSNITKYKLSKKNPVSVYYSEANFFYLSPVCMKPNFKDRFDNSKFGKEKETKEFMENLFKDISLAELKKLVVYDPNLTVSTSIIRSGKRYYTVTKPGKFDKSTKMLSDVYRSSIRGAPQTLNQHLEFSRALMAAFKQFRKDNSPKIDGAFRGLLCRVIKQLDEITYYGKEPNIAKSDINQIIEVYGNEDLIKTIKEINKSKFRIIFKTVQSYKD